MRLEYPRTSVAALLTAAAVALPCAAWFLAGQNQLMREEQLQASELHTQAFEKGAILAQRLSTRFELLREAESRRGFYQYQNLYHDPKGVAEGRSISVSPLAQGPTDPLIDAYFQVDAEGVLSLPTLNDKFPELGFDGSESAQCELLWKLSDVAIFYDLESADTLPLGSRWNSGSLEVVNPEESGGLEDATKVLEIPAESWRQHLRANELYADLQGLGVTGDDALDFAPGVRGVKVKVRLSPFHWHTLPVGGESALVALRTVDTPAGLWTQGFVIDSTSVETAMAASGLDVAFMPGRKAPDEPGEVSLGIDGTPWQVRVNYSSDLNESVSTLAETRSDFLKTFALAALGAAVAGLLVILMVWHSERLARQRSQFAAAAAHELRTPLAGLRLYGEMLAEGLGEPGRAAKYARRMASEAERLGRVVTNVLGFARLERGSISLSSEQGRLQEVVREAFGRQRLTLEESGAEVELRLDEELPPIAFDRDAMTHIIQNLLDNAEKYTRETENRRIVLSLERETENVVLSVADNGRGISKSLQRRLFRPFSRGSETDSPEGLGLGLVLVRMLARAQGADITYHDAPRGGAVFKVAFPLPEAPSTA
ncbi:MAG: HAMP domain-containing sensor histidine kinase [Acidobacteriota bacterium]